MRTAHIQHVEHPDSNANSAPCADIASAGRRRRRAQYPPNGSDNQAVARISGLRPRPSHPGVRRIEIPGWNAPVGDGHGVSYSAGKGRCGIMVLETIVLVAIWALPSEQVGSMLKNHSDRSEGKANPLVSKAHGKEKRWSGEYAELRQLCLASGLNEELKWGQAWRRRPAVIDYLKEAIAVEKSGAEVKLKSAAQFAVPAEFQTRLDNDPAVAEAFGALTPGRQKGYLLYFAGAKRTATRAARVEKHLPRILKGLGLSD